MSMAVIVPSRGRPGNVRRLIAAWSIVPRSVELHLMVDNDDPELDGYIDAVCSVAGWVHLWIDERRRLGGSLNHLAPILANVDWRDYIGGRTPPSRIIGFMGDDHVPQTPNWHDAIEAAMVPGGVVYGNDLIQGPNLPTAVFMDSRIVRALGWFVVPGMTHLFMDNLWKTLGEQLGTLRYLPDVIIEHVHPIAGRAEWDQTYVEANDGQVWEHDEAIYKEWVAFQMGADIAKIRAALNPGGL